MSRDVKAHRRSNPTLRTSRYPGIERLTRGCFRWASFWPCLFVYAGIAFFFVIADRTNEVVCGLVDCPLSMPEMLVQSAYREALVRDVTSYMIGAQVGVLGLLSIAVSLVTLIGQRQNSNAEVRVYYHESLAAQVMASSLALLAVLCGQLVWPLDLLAHQIGFSRVTMTSPIILSSIHAVWLTMNFVGLAHFAGISLTFGQMDARKLFRERYTANQLVLPHISDALFKHGFTSASQLMGLSYDKVSPVYFGTSFANLAPTEISVVFKGRRELQDVWLAPLGWALRRWQRRATSAVGTPTNTLGHEAFLAFALQPGVALEEGDALCHLKVSVRLSWLEARVVRHAFRFRRAE